MKKLILLAAVCLLTQMTHATPREIPNHYLIELTSGGFYEPDAEHWPQAFIDFLEDPYLLFFDEMYAVPYEIFGVTYPPGWVSQFGILDGGTYFFCFIDRTGRCLWLSSGGTLDQ